MLELCEKNTNINGLSLSLSLSSEEEQDPLWGGWEYFMCEVGDGDGWYYTSSADTEYDWMMRPGNCILALLSICKYRLRAGPRRKYSVRLMRSPRDTVLTCLLGCCWWWGCEAVWQCQINDYFQPDDTQSALGQCMLCYGNVWMLK